MTITLYHAPGACSIAAYVSLLEAGAEFDVVSISLAKKEQNSESYKALNPKQKVPYLIFDGKGGPFASRPVRPSRLNLSGRVWRLSQRESSGIPGNPWPAAWPTT